MKRAWIAIYICCLGVVAGSPAEKVETLVAELPGAVGGVAVDRVGYIYVADFGNQVWRVSPFGEVEVFADSLYGASGNSIDAQGRLLQSSFYGNSLHRIDRDGTITVLTTALNGPVGVTELSENDLAICNCSGNEIVKLDQQASLTVYATGTLFNCPNGITKASDDTLYIANFSDGRIIKIDPSGVTSVFAVIPGGGNGHLVLVGNELFVTGFRSNQLYRVDMEGKVQVAAGSGAFGLTDGPGAEAIMASPNGVAWNPSRDELYFNEYLVPFTQRSRSKPTSALRRVQFPTIVQAFNQANAASGIDAAIAAHRAYKQSRPGAFTQIQTNILGYQLLQKGKVDDAIRVFELNTQDYPNAFNPWDSLAEGHKMKGNKELAIKYYKKSLELNPGNTNAVNMLKEMGVEID